LVVVVEVEVVVLRPWMVVVVAVLQLVVVASYQ
jgi:hypothetical protein